MTQSTLETAPASLYAPLITFTWGDATGGGGGGPHVARYCRFTSDIIAGSDVFQAARIDDQTSTPTAAISVDFGQQQGGTDDDQVKLMIPEALEPVNYLAGGYAWAPVTVTIEQCDPSDAANTRRLIYQGNVISALKNPSGQSRMVQLTLGGPRRRLSTPLGVVAATTCAWRLGDAQCTIDLDSFKHQAVVSQMNVDGEPARIALTFVDLPGATYLVDPDGNYLISGDGDVMVDPSTDQQTADKPPAGRWLQGYVAYDGLRLMIRQDLADGRMDLARTPPPTWQTVIATVAPGCDKHLTTCRDTYDNEKHFGGMGYAMPSKNPLFENA